MVVARPRSAVRAVPRRHRVAASPRWRRRGPDWRKAAGRIVRCQWAGLPRPAATPPRLRAQRPPGAGGPSGTRTGRA
eukprot:139447-Chlamydomonas_euryale.AAC.2